MAWTITDTVRDAIKTRIAYAVSHPCDAAGALDPYAMTIGADLRVYYLHHVSESGVMAHLSLHPLGYRLQDAMIDQLADEFGLGPRDSCIISTQADGSVHVFKRLS